MRFAYLAAAGIAVLSTSLWAAMAVAPRPNDLAAAADKQFQVGNVKDAFDGYRRALTDSAYDGGDIYARITNALQCLARLNRVPESDEFLEAIVAAHPKNVEILVAVANHYRSQRHDGFMVAGKFERGSHRGGGDYVDATDRDRVRSLQIFVQALPIAVDSPANVRGDFFLQFAQSLLGNNGYYEAWKLQALTDLAKLPDYEQGYRYYRGEEVGAPVDAAGNPLFYAVPESFEKATSDGERWRWALAEAAKVNDGLRRATLRQYADFLNHQFGTQTMARYGHWFAASDDDKNADRPQTFALHTLTDEETIARLATDVKRFKLPDEHNPIKIHKELAEGKDGYADGSRLQLADIYENRRQFDTAVLWWKKLQEITSVDMKKIAQARIDQIVGNWGTFEGQGVQPAGRGAEFEFRFRNAQGATFTAHKIHYDRLLDDIKKYLQGSPSQVDWQQIDVGQLGWRIVTKNQKKYVGEQVAEWKLDLQPRAMHFDRRITVTSPLEKAGAYLVTAKVADGNESRSIIWLADTVIVKKPLDGKTLVYVADAVSGQPIPKASVEFFGYRMKEVKIPIFGSRWVAETKNFAEFTDADGQIQHDFHDPDRQYSWLSIARTDDGRLAHYGFDSMWHGQRYDQQYNEVKTFGITDRPVYRPNQRVQFKFWIRQAKYDLADEENNRFADQAYNLELFDPQGTSVGKKQIRSDKYGGLAGDYELPSDTKLGLYRLQVDGYGALTFRVEEYKKPEYEVTVEAPSEPVKLGDKITAEVVAKYYFGAPVTEAKVKYKVLRTPHDARWFPVGRWDWLYGRGYWWFGYDYRWFPGFHRWGCLAPLPWWQHTGPEQPEVVAERETEIGPDGKLKIEIDTALAKEIHGDQDHRYEITAEVVDASRRTIVGSGEVLVAREPFKVFAWVDRGHYREGDTVLANFSAHTLSDKPIKGSGKLQLLKLSYPDGEPKETLVEEWPLDTDAEGNARQQITAGAVGQYRLSYKLKDAKGNEQEGGYVFAVMGDQPAGGDFRFNAIELVADQREYAPGEKVRLQVNTDRIGSTVLLFVRPSNGIYTAPQILKLDGKSQLVEIEVSTKDMPNFFAEAVTIADGKLHVEKKEIVVPPASRVVDVAVKPSHTEYKPGQEAEIELSLVGPDGKAFVGQTVVAVYDKAVEYISGGSNVPEIKEFFWKWRRHHYPQTESSLSLYFHPLYKEREVFMQPIGAFGGSIADDSELESDKNVGAKRKDMPARGNMYAGRSAGDRAMAFGGGMGGMAVPAAPASAAAAAEGMVMDAAAAGKLQNGVARREAKGNAAPGPEVAATVRSNFADTALWIGALETNSDGIARAKLTMPENLTTWKIKTWAMGAGTSVGEGSVDVVTTKNLLIRLQAPRFFTEYDEVVLSANVHNYLKTAKQVRVVLELGGGTLEALSEASQTVEIPADGEKRVDWKVKVVREGEAVVRMKALTDEESDAMEMKFPVYVHGMLKTESFSGVLRPEQSNGKLTFDVPEARRVEESRLEVRYSPTLAGAMVDALPYLVSYPYGCTEQTLSRFLPTVITQRVLNDMGLDLKDIQKKRTNLNAQQIGEDQERAKQWQTYKHNPVFDADEVTKMVKGGVQRLTDMQCSDGGWGWFSGYGEHSYPHTTAYVVHGFQIARQNDVALVPGVLERGIEWLNRYQDEQVTWLKNAGKKNDRPKKSQADNLDAFVFMVLVDADHRDADMLKFLERDRPKLSAYALSMYGMALHKLGEVDKLAGVLQNLAQYVVEDQENQTAYLNLGEGNNWWYWYGSENEAMAYYLKLLSAVDPKSRVASGMVKYLLNNRQNGTYWKSTRDTALCIEALADYLKASGEGRPNLTVELWLDGKKRKEVTIDGANLFSFDNSFVLEGEELTTGRHTLEVRKSGEGPLYYNAYQTNFTKEKFITKAGLEVKVDRKYYKLVRVDAAALSAGSRGQAVTQKVEKYERQELANMAELKSGDLIEIELEIDSKNDYEYLMFEDMKAAGCEPVDVRSGYNGNGLGAYMELRDERVCLFTRVLPRGKHSVSYRVRAEIPGTFSALPTRAEAMYAPELRGNSDEMKISITD
jgi:uncharacterized protein YfaS (alpha-2-macroglobulin family)